MRRNHAASLAVVLAVAATGGCSLLRVRSEHFVESPWYAGSEDVLWDAALDLVGREYRLAETDPVEGVFETEWRVRLSPFKGEGKRRKVKGRIEERDRLRRVLLRVIEEKNMELDRPLVREAAKWKGRTEDPLQARVLLRRLHGVLTRAGFRVVRPGSQPE